MVTAVDSSVLIAIYKGEQDGAAWVELFQNRNRLGRVVVCEVVVAETAGVFREPNEVVRFLQDLQVEFDYIKPDSAILAGLIFQKYRRAGGPREHLLPDFLIGAHALHQTSQIAATDRGYLRRYFPKLKVIAPP